MPNPDLVAHAKSVHAFEFPPRSLRVIFSIARWQSRRMLDLRECRGDRKMSLIHRRAFERTAPNSRTCRSTATARAQAHPTVSIRDPHMSALGHKRTLSRLHPMSALPPKADIVQDGRDVRFVPKADEALASNHSATIAGKSL